MLGASLAVSSFHRVHAQSVPSYIASLERRALEAERSGQLKNALDLHIRAWRGLYDSHPAVDSDAFRECERIDDLIMRLAGRLEPLPPLPAAAAQRIERAFRRLKQPAAPSDRGGVFGEHGAFYQLGIDDLIDARMLAPWSFTLRYNLGLALESYGDVEYAAGSDTARFTYRDTLEVLNAYVLARPEDAAARETIARVTRKRAAAERLPRK